MTTYVVTTLSDENDAGASVAVPGGAGLSLREAVLLANSSAGADTITFATGPGTIRLTSELVVTEALTINGDLGDDGTPDILITGDANGDDTTAGATGITDIDALTGALNEISRRL